MCSITDALWFFFNLNLGLKKRGGIVKLTTHLHLMTRMRISGGILLRPHTPSRFVQRLLYFHFVVKFIHSPFHHKFRGASYANIGRRDSSHRGNRTSHSFYKSHCRVLVYKVLFTVTSKCVCRDWKRSENTKAWKDVGLSDFAVVAYRHIPLWECISFTLLEFAFRALFSQSTHMYKYVYNILMYRAADKSLARPGTKQANVSVRMA